jgi:copper transport protein
MGAPSRSPLPPHLIDGTHVLSWRVVSEDGHPISGSVVFSIGAANASALFDDQRTDSLVSGGLWIAKAALYAGLFIGVGGAFAIAWIARGARSGRRAVLLVLAVGTAGTLLALGFQGLDALGTGAGHLLDPATWSTAMGTSFGATAVGAAAALALAAISLFVSGLASRLTSLAAMLLVGIALALSGHASAADPQWLMRPAVFLHGVTVAFWTGALIPLGVALARREPDAVDGLRRFSRVIPYSLAILILAGLVLAIVQVGEPGALVTTAYGQLLLAKLGLLAGLFGLAAINRWWLTVPVLHGDSTATRRFVRSIIAETAIVLVVFAVAAGWRFTPPPRALAAAASSQRVTAHLHADGASASLHLVPGDAGTAEAHLSLLRDSEPLPAKQVTLALSNPLAGIEPIMRPATGNGADWVALDLALPAKGEWLVRADVLVSDFEMLHLEGELHIGQPR